MVGLRMETQVPCHWLFKAHVSSLQQIGEGLAHFEARDLVRWWGMVGVCWVCSPEGKL